MDPATRKAIVNNIQINNTFKSTWNANLGFLAYEKQTVPILGSPHAVGRQHGAHGRSCNGFFPPTWLCHALPFPNAHMGPQPHLHQPKAVSYHVHHWSRGQGMKWKEEEEMRPQGKFSFRYLPLPHTSLLPGTCGPRH